MQDDSNQMPTSTSRAVQLDSFGGPEVLDLREVPAPQAGPGQIRVRVTAAGLNPMDWFMTSDAETASRFGLGLPAGFGTDDAGVVDQVGEGVRLAMITGAEERSSSPRAPRPGSAPATCARCGH